MSGGGLNDALVKRLLLKPGAKGIASDDERPVMNKPGCLANGARLAGGSTFALPGLVLYGIASWEGVVQSFIFALVFALGLRWGVLGLMGFFKPLPPRRATYAAAVGLAAVMALAGPTLSDSYHKSQEPKAWLKVSEVDQTAVWDEHYIRQVPERYRRPEWASRFAEVECEEALQIGDFGKMREVALRVFNDDSKTYDDQVRKHVQSAYKELFARGLKSIKPTKLANPEMTAAFKKALEAIAGNPNRRLLLKVDAKGGVGPTAADKAYMSDLSPEYAKLPILAVGDAFGPPAEARRANSTRDAIQSSLNAVIPADLASIELATGKPSPEDVQFLIDADIRRLDGFYINSSNDVPDAFLYKMEVFWKFRVVVDGKTVGDFSFRSEPAKSVNYSTNPGDPDWAPYSIMMDSASDNFARLVVGSLGLEPPAEKTSYTFTPNEAPAPQPAPNAPQPTGTPKG